MPTPIETSSLLDDAAAIVESLMFPGAYDRLSEAEFEQQFEGNALLTAGTDIAYWEAPNESVFDAPNDSIAEGD